jgi:hypothetical protein
VLLDGAAGVVGDLNDQHVADGEFRAHADEECGDAEGIRLREFGEVAGA